MAKSAVHRRKMDAKRAARDEAAAAEPAASYQDDDDDEDDEDEVQPGGLQRSKGASKIKWKYIVMLGLLTGTAVLPAALWVVDNVASASGSALSASLSAFGGRVGLTATPKSRLEKFYEKHNPDKLPEIPALIHKYAGNYDKMIKVLEAKYHDYGFFLGWRDDAAFKTIAKTESIKYYNRALVYYRRYVPYKLRGAFYNMYYNAERILGPPIYLAYDVVFVQVLGWPPLSSKSTTSSSRRSPSSKKTTSTPKPGGAKAKKRTVPSSTRRASSSN